MDKKFMKWAVENAESTKELATMICGYGWFDHSGTDYPVKREYIEEYLEIGRMFERSKTNKNN